MEKRSFTFQGSDGKEIFARQWLPDDKTVLKAVLQVAHGMAEHGSRYEDFARFLAGNGFAVYVNDHRGHGKTAGSLENIGFFAKENGWDLVVEDMHLLTGVIRRYHPDRPVFLFGHSMGSFLSRDYISRYGEDISGCILSATASDPGLLGYAGIVISAVESLVRGKQAASPLMDKLSFGSFNKRFKPERTKFDWLSRDEKTVDRYVDDPYCGTVFTAGFFSDLLKGIKKIHTPQNFKNVPRDLPVFILAGKNDPVGNFGKGVEKVCKKYQQQGLKDLTIKLYDDGRHEMLNEINRQEVYRDISDWLEKHVKP